MHAPKIRDKPTPNISFKVIGYKAINFSRWTLQQMFTKYQEDKGAIRVDGWIYFPVKANKIFEKN